MGQAKLRGTFDERQAKAVAIQAEITAKRIAERDERERINEERKAALWAKMTPAEREKELERAKAMATLYGQWSEIVGPETALAMVDIMDIADQKALTSK